MFSAIELKVFEKLLEMDFGYVLDFSNNTFNDFIISSIGIDVYDECFLDNVKKKQGTASKANILRYLWKYKDFEDALKLTSDFIEYYEIFSACPDVNLLNKAKSILNRYSDSLPVISERSSEKRIIDLIREINRLIVDKNPIFAIDRLHTLLHNILRNLCYSHNINFNKNEGIDKLFKKYVSFLKNNEYIESKMSEAVFKSSGSLLSMFNNVRNNNSYAHDNQVLSQEESLLIFKQVVNIMEFISEIDDNFIIYSDCLIEEV